MAFTLEVAESEIENLKGQVVESRRLSDKAIAKMESFEKEINTTNILLAKLDATQNETLKAVNSIIENGGTNRCVERGFIIRNLEEKIEYLENHRCDQCKNEKKIQTIINKQNSLRVIFKWLLIVITPSITALIIWYFTNSNPLKG